MIHGVLEVYTRRPLEPDSEWLNFIEALGQQAAIAVDNANLFEDLQRSNLELTLAYDATIEGWSRALDLRDKETEGHTPQGAAARYRQAGSARPCPAQTQPADRGRMDGHAHAPHAGV